eukprot:TRINITY_DN29742_c0_g1_i1.p1 TRINITY_DN29742_c0_g1~~TRINITY_DN29742_c0_g1_i1.p1  ORF type:complete len:778 (-),score=88.85 TRINITY_DN29742_c0_g1_i1:376-2709(-)
MPSMPSAFGPPYTPPSEDGSPCRKWRSQTMPTLASAPAPEASADVAVSSWRASWSLRSSSLVLPLMRRRSSSAEHMLERDPFHENRRLALIQPERAVETLLPWAQLHLNVIEARDLPSSDWSGFSDPFVEVYVNDKLMSTSHRRSVTLNPKWDYVTKVDIWSPLSVVQLRVLDYDHVSEHDRLGFVEFCVADLIPNEDLAGWFELRLPKALLGTANERLRTHMLARDEESDSEDEDHADSSVGQSSLSTYSYPQPGKKSVFRMPKWKHGSSRASSKVWNAFCSSGGPKPRVPGQQSSDDSADTRAPEAIRKTAGDIHLSMRLSPCADDPTDEFFAFCIPHPVQCEYVSPDVTNHTVNLLHVWEDMVYIQEVIVDGILRRLYLAFLFLVSWQNRLVSATVLLWWWTVCCWGFLFLPSLPLWIAAMLFLLRQETWRGQMMAHEAFAPLNDEGFAIVAAKHESRRMATWVQRVIISMGGTLMQKQELVHFVSLVFRDSSPIVTFEELTETLREQSWIAWRKPPKCQFCRSAYKYLGTSSMETWRCVHGKDCLHAVHHCHHRRCRTVSDASEVGQTLFFETGRLHCHSCNTDLCEECFRHKQRHPPMLAKMPHMVVPHQVDQVARSVEGPLHNLRKHVTVLRRRAMMFLEPTEQGEELAKNIYTWCFTISAAVGSLSWLNARGGEFSECVKWFISLSWIALGTVLILAHLPYWGRAWTALRAFVEMDNCRYRRLMGGPHKNWAFFTPDEDSHAVHAAGPRMAAILPEILRGTVGTVERDAV